MRANWKRPGLTWPSLITLGALGAFVVAGSPANAKGLCDARAKVLSTLENNYGEKPVAYGIAANGSMVQLIAAQGGKTWTLVVHSPNGSSCLMAAGEIWKQRPKSLHFALKAGGPR